MWKAYTSSLSHQMHARLQIAFCKLQTRIPHGQAIQAMHVLAESTPSDRAPSTDAARPSAYPSQAPNDATHGSVPSSRRWSDIRRPVLSSISHSFAGRTPDRAWVTPVPSVTPGGSDKATLTPGPTLCWACGPSLGPFIISTCPQFFCCDSLVYYSCVHLKCCTS